MKRHAITIDGERFLGAAHQLIPKLLAKAEEAENNEENPHPYLQYAEHLQKESEHAENNQAGSGSPHARTNNAYSRSNRQNRHRRENFKKET